MTELSPRVTYSPDGILELRRTFTEDASVEYRERVIGRVASRPGYLLQQEGEDLHLSVELAAVIDVHGDIDPRTKDKADVIALIENLAGFGDVEYEDHRDGVASLDMWTEHGATGVIRPQFQRWLMAGGLDEDTSRAAIRAMALPFGDEMSRTLLHGFRFVNDGDSIGAMTSNWLQVAQYRDSFTISRSIEKDTTVEYSNGTVLWPYIDFTTMGNCACWGNSGTEREAHISSERGTRLYTLSPHNIDRAVESLSVVLGLGALAYKAKQYDGTEDIFEGVRWHDTREFPLLDVM